VRRLAGDDGLVVIELVKELGNVLVFWLEADAFNGEDVQPRLIEWPWPNETAQIVDVFGSRREMAVGYGPLSLGVGNTPLFVS
jgi:hypothetical protein